MRKKAQSYTMRPVQTSPISFSSQWPNIYRLLKSPPPGITLGDFPSKVPSMDKFILESSPPPQKSGALAFVTTEDVDKDGKIDKIHLVVPNLERNLKGFSAEDLTGKDLEKLKQLLMFFVETVSHEMTHIMDYKHGEKEPFPGGESKAETGGSEAARKVLVTAKDKSQDYLFRRKSMKKEVILRLVKLAGDLDQKGVYSISDQITKIAQDMVVDKPGPILESGEPLVPGESMSRLKAKVSKAISQFSSDPEWTTYFMDKFAFAGLEPEQEDTMINTWIQVIKNWNILARQISGEPGSFADWKNSRYLKYWCHVPRDEPQKGIYFENRILPEGQTKVWPEGFTLNELPGYMLQVIRRITETPPTPEVPSKKTNPMIGDSNITSGRSKYPASSWPQYVEAGSEATKSLRKKISQIWEALTSFEPNQLPGYDQTFQSFMKWYVDTNKPTVEKAYEELYGLFKSKNIPASAAEDSMLEADSMDDVIKNASVNSMFWNGTPKTPFGR